MLANTLAPLAAVVPSYVHAEDTGAPVEVSTSSEDEDKVTEGQDSVDENKEEEKEVSVEASDTSENKVEENGTEEQDNAGDTNDPIESPSVPAEENGNGIENENPGEDAIDPEAPDIIEGGGVSDYRPIADIEDNETVEVVDIPMPVVVETDGSAPAENIEPVAPVVEVKEYEYLEDGM